MWGAYTINATKLSADLYGYEGLFLILYANKISRNEICSLLSHYSAHKYTVLHKRYHFEITTAKNFGKGSSICIAIDYGLDGPGSNLGGD